MWGFVVPIFALIIAILIPALLKTRMIAGRVVCEHNLNGLSIAMLMYVGRYDGKYPLPNQWCDFILREPGSFTEKAFHCPLDSEGSFSYAMNKTIFEIEPGQTPAKLVMFFEANLGRNGIGGMEEVVLRHDKDGQPGCNVSFVDGHVEFVTKDRIAGLMWTTEKNKGSQ
jgi:prepilin-type processing-associated H-X9-DG protein